MIHHQDTEPSDGERHHDTEPSEGEHHHDTRDAAQTGVFSSYYQNKTSQNKETRDAAQTSVTSDGEHPNNTGYQLTI